MSFALWEQAGDERLPADGIHPSIDSIVDALTFKIARLSALNERSGSHYFKSEQNVTLNQWRVLGLTAAHGPVSSREVRSLLYMDKGQFSRVLKELVERNLISAKPLKGDARAIELRLTPAGESFHQELLSFTAARNEAVVSVLTTKECAELLGLLDKVTSHTEKLQRTAGIIK